MDERSLYNFQLLQIEAIVFLLIDLTMAISTWRAFAGKSAAMTENPRLWVAGFLAIFLLFSGIFISGLGVNNFLLGVEIALGVVLSFLRPINALCFFISLLFLRPWEIAQQEDLLLIMPRFMGILAIASTFMANFRSGFRHIKLERAHYLLLAFAAWTFLSTFFAPNVGEQQSAFFDGYARAVIIFFLITACIKNMEDIDLLKEIFLFSIAGLTAVSLYLSWDMIMAGPVTGDVKERLKAIGSLENANDIAAVVLIGVPFVLRHFMRSWRNVFAWMQDISFLVLTILALYLAQSRGAVLGFVVGLVCWWLVRSQKKIRILLLCAVLGAVALPAAKVLFHRNASDLSESGTSRIQYWRAGVKMALKNPLAGVGFGMYPNRYQEYAEGELFEYGERTAHSSWVLALAETGIPGFIFFILFIWEVAHAAKLLLKEEPDIGVAFFSYLVAITFLSHTYLIYPYILFGMVIAAHRIHKTRMVTA